MADRPYVRVFHADMIRDYPQIWDDDAALAAWLRLLVVADGSWPAPAELPRSVRARSLTALTDAGLVGMDGPHRFRVKGMDSDRTQRQDAARNAAAKRWHSGAHSDGIKRGNAPPMPNNSEQSNTEQSSSAPAPNDPFHDPEHEVIVWLAKHGCDVRPGNGYHQKLVTAVEHHGVNALIGMMDRLAKAGTKQGDIKGFLFGAVDALDARSRPSLTEIAASDRAEEREDDFQRRVARTRDRNAEIAASIESVVKARSMT